MAEVNIHEPGTFCWVDLVTSNVESVKEFYTKFFDWETKDIPLGEGGIYTIFEKDGKRVAAVFEMPDQLKLQKISSHWQSYISVENIAQVTEKVLDLDGKIVLPHFEIIDFGKMAGIQDSMGTMLFLWEPGKHIGTQRINEQGTLYWNELYTRNANRAAGFYTELFGWTTREVDTNLFEKPYIQFEKNDKPVGGMIEIDPDLRQMASTWEVFFLVDNLDEFMQKAHDLGGTVEAGPIEFEDKGRFSILHDPEEAHFAIIQPEKDEV